MRWYFSVIRRYRVQYRISINTITCIAHKEIISVIFLGRNSLGKLLVLLIICNTRPFIYVHSSYTEPLELKNSSFNKQQFARNDRWGLVARQNCQILSIIFVVLWHDFIQKFIQLYSPSSTL